MFSAYCKQSASQIYGKGKSRGGGWVGVEIRPCTLPRLPFETNRTTSTSVSPRPQQHARPETQTTINEGRAAFSPKLPPPQNSQYVAHSPCSPSVKLMVVNEAAVDVAALVPSCLLPRMWQLSAVRAEAPR